MDKTLDNELKQKLESRNVSRADSVFLLNKLLKKSYILFTISSLLSLFTIFYFSKILKLAYIVADTFLNSIVILRPDVWFLGWVFVFFSFSLFCLIYSYFKKKRLNLKDDYLIFVKVYKDYKLIDLINFILVIVTIINFILTFLTTPATISGRSMEPKFNNGDKILFQSFIVNPKINNIVIAKPKILDKIIIKRIKATAGDILTYRDGYLYRNDDNLGNLTLEEWNIISSDKQSTFIIPNNYYLLIGDNYSDSFDSRYFGLFAKSDIIGIFYFTFYPLNRIGF